MLDLEIREQIGRYARGRIDGAELDAWLSAEAADAEDAATQQLAFDALRLLSEGANGDWEDEDLRDRLGALSRFYWFQQAPKNVIPASGSIFIRRSRWSAGTDRSRVAEYA